MRKIVFGMLVVMLFAGNVMAGTAGEFQLPYDKNEIWVDANGNKLCYDNVGYKDKPDQYFMEWIGVLDNLDGTQTIVNQYNMGEDWNGVCGTDTDRGAELRAIADGEVVEVGSKQPTGKILIVEHTLPDGTKVDSVYAHVKDIYVNVGDIVTKNQLIATIGDGNGTYSGGDHLHWEMRTDLDMEVFTPSLKNPLTMSEALQYVSPSLFVDDRRFDTTFNLSGGHWNSFEWYFNAPSVTAYIEYNGEKYTLQDAVSAKLIYEDMYKKVNGAWLWKKIPNINDVTFESGYDYAVRADVNYSSLTILTPGNNYLDERARQDMVNAAAEDPHFDEVWIKDFVELQYHEDANYVYRKMRFRFTRNDGTGGAVFFYHATSQNNPLKRYVWKYIIDTGAMQGGWVDWNTGLQELTL